jgi:GrpB-like predicted nucleotidyltransferase (UPF0157 family)
MSESLHNKRAPATDAEIEAFTIGGARPHRGPIHLAEYDPAWRDLFTREATRIMQILGDTAKRVEHVGSTSVPGLAAKPIIDILMEVADSSDEPAYVTPLESNAYELRIREPDAPVIKPGPSALKNSLIELPATAFDGLSSPSSGVMRSQSRYVFALFFTSPSDVYAGGQ